MAINWDLAYSSAKKLDEEKEKEISKRKKVEPTTNGTNKSTGSKANPSFSNEEEKKAYVENSKVSSSRAGIESESNISAADEKARKFVNANRGKETAYLATEQDSPNYVVTTKGGTAPAITPAVNASVAERNAARRSAKKENTEKKFTQPGNSGQLPGDARTQNGNTHVEIDESKNKAEQISELNERIKDEKYYKSDIQNKEALNYVYTRKYNSLSPDGKAVLSFINREDETEDYMKWAGIAAGFAGMEGGGGAIAGQLAGSMTTSQEARKILKEYYGMSDKEIDAAVILHNRARNTEIAKRQEAEMKQIANENPFLASAISVPMGVASDVMPIFEIADNFEEKQNAKALGMAEFASDNNSIYSLLGKNRDTLQGTVSENINKKHGEFAATTYSAVMGGITNAAEGVAFGKANEAVLSINAGVGAYKNARARGLSDEECLKTAAVAIAAEFIGEHIGSAALRSGKKVLGKTMREFAEKTLTPDTFGKFLLTTAKNAGSNAGEEVLTSIINKTYDYFANGELSEYQLSIDAYMADGSSEEEAIKKAKSDIVKSLLNDAYAGAVTGLMFNAPNAVSYGMGQASIASTGKYAKQEGLTPSVIAAAKEAPQGSKPNKLAGKAGENKSGKISSYTVGKIAKANSEFYSNESTGRFSNVKTEAELEERYQSAIQMKKDKGSDSVKQIQKEYEQAKARIRMQAAAKAEADKFEGAQKTERKANELTRIEITNPTIEVDGKRYSLEGKNFDSKTEEIGEAQTIFKDADGDNAVRFGDGQTMKVSEAVEKMTDETAKEVYKATEGMSPEAANLFISNYDGDTVPEYKDAFKYYFNMGRAGLTAEDIRKDNELYGTYFTAEAQQQIATAGLKSREFKAGVTELTLSRSTKPYKQTVQLIDQWAKESGLEVIILKNSDKVNGYHLQGTNRIVLYTEVDGKENILTRTFGHETFHFISENSSAEAEKLRRYVIEALEKNGVDIEKALQKYADITDGEGNNVYSTRESQIDELVADSMFDVFTNKAAIERLAKNDRTLAQKIYDKFKDILKIIKSKLKLFDTMNNNPEIRALMNDADSLEQIVNKFHDALDVAKNNFNVHDSGKNAGNGQKNNADGTAKQKKYSFNSYSEKQLQNWEKSKRIVVYTDVGQYENFIDNALIENNNKKIYFGAIGKSLAEKIKNETNIDVENFNCSLSSYEIRKIIKNHGNERKEALRGQRAVTKKDFLEMPNIILEPDEIKLSDKKYNGKPAILFMKKKGNEKTNVIAVVSNDHMDLFIQTSYINKKGNLAVPTDEQASVNTPMANNGTVSKNIIPKKLETVNNNLTDGSQNDAAKKIPSMNSSAKSLDEMKADRSTLQNEYRELKEQIDNLKASAEYIAFEDEIRKVRKNGSLFGGFEAVKEIRRQRDEWADEAGLTELQKRYHDISEQIHDYDLAIYKIEKEQKIKATEETAKKVKAFTHDVVMKYATDAAKKFGITKKFENAGYMLPDGKLLDFSDGQGYRVLDHREIKSVLDFLPDGHNYSDGLIQFMNMGNIRMQIGGIDISRMPSNEQIPVLRKFFKENNGEITVDFSKENGDNAGSVEYPAGTSSDRIINDIKSYFTTGNVPKLTGAAAFHAMYSRNGDSAIDAHYGEVVKENKHWRAIVSMLTDEKFSSIRKDVYLNGSYIHRISKELIKKASSKYDLATFENQLTAIFDYIATSKSHVDTDAVFSAIYQLSNDVLGESEIKDTELYEQYADVRKFLHDVEIYIPDNVRKEINSQFGDFKSFRNQLMGKVMHIGTKNTNARSLDEVWQELSEIAPEYFPKDMNELDMPMQLTRFFDSIAPKIVNPYEHYEMNIEEEAAVFATEILESYYKIRVEKTDSGKARDIIKEGMRQLQINRKALQNDFKRKEQENADEYRERIAEYKFQRAEGDRRRRLRNEIERNYNYLNRRLVRETDKDRILKQFQPLVSAFRDIVPDSNSRFSRKALTEFENEYRKLEEVSTFYNEDFANIISDFKDRVTGIDVPRMRDIDGYELDVLRNITEHVKYIVQNENRLFSEGLNGRVEEFGKSVHNELFEKKDSKDQGVPERGAKKTDKIRNGVNSFIKGLTKPEYLFEGIGSPTVKALYDELRKGENIEAKIVYDAKLAEQEIKKRNNYDQRWEAQTVTLDLRSGKRNVTIEDVMALYATSRRKQGLEHMLNGGVILYSKKELTKKNGKSSESIKRDTIKFTDEDIRILEKSLTKDQKNYVNDMVEYITKTIGEKRNEVSMKLYGIEKYKESFYFPIKVDRNFVDTSVGKQEVVSTIKNQSSSKRTVDHARNPIEITGFTDTVNNHVFDSALYCAYVLPINDFKRVYNYREKVYDGDGVESLVPREISVKDDIRRTSGVNAIKEIERFMISLDSGSRYENIMPFSAKLMARTKKTAVMANLSVVVQQPTAVFRAMLYISPKHFATWANKADIEEMKRWNGCALKKEIGYFDVNMGRSATDYMNEYSTEKSIKEDWSLSDKVKNSNTMLKIDQAAGFLASKADEQTWGAIWKACKKQVKTENPGLSGDSLNAAAAELFQTTISKTQVYDSVFTKPEYMRRKEGFAMMATQFMSEPLTSLNMLAESIAKAKNTEKGSQQRKDALKFSARAFGCYITSVVVNSALKGIIYAMRDDDDDETFLEKYISNVAESIVTDPIGMVPYLKDILSIVQGYDLNRADVAVFTTMADAIKDLGSDKKTTFEKIMSVMKAAGQASGIPVYNVMRDAKSIIDIAIKIKEGVENGFPETTGRGVLNELKETFDWLPGIDAENNYEQLYSSIVKGDKKHYDRVYNSLVADGKAKSNIENGIGKVLAEKNSVLAEAFNLILADKSVEASEKIQELKNAGFSNEIINNALSTYKTNLKNDLVENEEESEDNRIKQAAFARYDMDYTLYESLVDELVADGYNETIVREAIDSEKVELEKAASEFSLNEKDEYTATYDMRNALQKNNFDNFESVYKKIAENSGESEAKKNAKTEIKKAYKDGHISEGKAGEILKEYVDSDYSDTDVWKELYKAKSSRDSIYDKMYDAIDNGGNFSIDYLLEQGIEKDDIAGQIATYAKPKLLEMEVDSKEYNEMYENILDAYVTVGKTEAYGASRIRKWHSDAAKAERKKNMRK